MSTDAPPPVKPLFRILRTFALIVLVTAAALGSVYLLQLPAKPVAVSGVVKVNGKPLPSGVINFRPADPNRGSYAMGLIGPDGRYTAETPHLGPGVLPGHYRVGVLAQADPTKYTPEEYDALVGPGKPGLPSLIPKAQTDPETSNLSLKITASGPQTYDVDITAAEANRE
jgi:hypothetical protein